MMPQTSKRNALINSVLANISASVAVTIIHECGHFFTSLLLGNSATLFHNRVETHGVHHDFLNQLLIPLGGPAISLLQGILCLLLHKKVKNDFASLFFLWMGISGLMGFFGYMMIAPVAHHGDTGRIFALLEIPFIWQLGIALASLLVFTYMLLFFHRDFEKFISDDIQNEKLLRVKWAQALIMYPIIISIPMTVALQFPIVVFLSILPSITMPFMLFMVYGRLIMSKTMIVKSTNRDIGSISKHLVAGFVLSIIVYRLLVVGVTI